MFTSGIGQVGLEREKRLQSEDDDSPDEEAGGVASDS
jgi:hypothetical protein